MNLNYKFTFLLNFISNLLSLYCIKANCIHPPDIENGYVQISESEKSYEVGDEVTYKCDIGHYRDGGRGKSKCTENGEWSDPGIKCLPMQCPRLENPQYGRIVGPQVAYLSIVTFECNSGYDKWTKYGNMERVCMEDGTWNGEEFECRPVKCPDLIDIENGSVTPKTGVYKSKVEYKCNAQYTLKGDSSRECLIDGSWSSSAPQCFSFTIVDSCPNPLSGEFKYEFNYLKTEVKIGIEPGHKVTFICLNDDQRKVISTCTNDGKWDPKPPSKDYCLPPTTVATTTEPSTTTILTITTTMFLPIDDVTIRPSQDGKGSTEKPGKEIVTTKETPGGPKDPSQNPQEDEGFPAWIIVLISLTSAGVITAIIAFVLMKKIKKNRTDNNKLDAEMESFANNRAHIAIRPAVNNSLLNESALNKQNDEMESLTKTKESE